MSTQIVVQVAEEERRSIEILFERINSIHELAMTLADRSVDEQNSLYEKLINDLVQSKRKYNEKWNDLKIKYSFNNNDKDYTLNFITGEISVINK